MRNELEYISQEMSEQKLPHLFVVFNTVEDQYQYSAFLEEKDVCEIIRRLSKDYGTEVMDKVIDRIIEEGEWPETFG